MAGVVCGQLDITQISEDELVAISGYGAWVAYDVEERIYELPNSTYGYVRIKFNNPCLATPCNIDNTATVGQAFLMIANSLNNSSLKSTTENANVDNGGADLPGSGIPSSNFCGVEVELLKDVQENVDSLQANEKGFQAAAVRPTSCVIPIKSNVFSYGPWASNNFSTTYGGAEIQVNNDLSPWLFGSISSMNIAGQELANTSIIGLSRAERGSVTLLGLPSYSIGTALSNGPVLSNISVSFGSNGVSTTYDFSTYTPKFGQVSRAIIEKYKTINKIRNEQLRFLRQAAIINNKVQNKRFLNAINNRNSELSKSISDKNSMGRVFVGEIFDYQETLNNGIGQRTVVGTTTLSKSVLEMRGSGYLKKGFMSLDGLYGPVSISGDGDLPRFVTISGDYKKSWTSAPQPPFMTEELTDDIQSIPASGINDKSEIISIHKDYLDPLANPNKIPYHEGNSAGHCIDMVGRETGLTSSGLITNFYRPEWEGKYSNDYRFLGMRGPLVLHSWGYDTEGKPVPNETDEEEDTKNGIFKRDNLANRFMEDWLQKPSTWPVAPIDLRLDRDRGVWVAPREHKIVVVKVLEDIEPYQKGHGQILNYGIPLTDKDGNTIDENFVVIEDRLGISYKADENENKQYYAYFDSTSSTYLLLSGSSGGTAELKFALSYGPWAINTLKEVVDAAWNDNVKQWTIAPIKSGSTETETFFAHNALTNINRTDEYIVVLTKISGIYMYVNGGSC